MGRKTFLFFLLLLVFASITIIVYADVPSVISVTRRNERGNLLIDVRVRHADPSTSHYISQVNVDLDGTVKTFTDLVKATTVEATYTINLGSVNPTLVKAQSVCIIHGAGAYFSETGSGGSTGGIPSYPYESIIAGLLLGVAVISMLSNSRLYSHSRRKF